tara:strand:+ start:29 stop:340 length:312 start_codon:yes stop_codon:yes gene_type:complete
METYNKINAFTEQNCIYRISCKNSDIKDFYIGRAKNMRKRAKEHYRTSKTGSLSYLYCFIRHNGGIENFEFDIIEKDISIDELNIKESNYLVEMKPSLNTKKK